MLPSSAISVSTSERLFPITPQNSETVTALSLLDATTADFAQTNAVWLFEKPSNSLGDGFELASHLRSALLVALNSYPQWCGQVKAVRSRNGTVQEPAQCLPKHARKFGRLYAHFGCSDDPGVEFIIASSGITLDDLYGKSRPAQQPIWDRQNATLNELSPPTVIANAFRPNEADEAGHRKPLLAIQLTKLACGGFALAAKIAHPLADISALIRFVKDWASISISILTGTRVPVLDAVFQPERLDAAAAGDINADTPDSTIIRQAESLPLHRYDWWAQANECPWPNGVPTEFEGEDLSPYAKAMPWSEWDVSAPVSSYIFHFSKEQIETIWKRATHGISSSLRISKHDALLAHLWASVIRARNLQQDTGPVHCDLVLGLRPTLGLGDAFIGSPTMMINVELPASEVATTAEAKSGRAPLTTIAEQIRTTISKVNNSTQVAAHIYSIAYEKSPQRIWQAFLGRRHILVTSWARAGIYDVDFGVGSTVRYADGVLPAMDGNILIKEAPPSTTHGSPQAWTNFGVDVSVHIGEEDMKRLIDDPLLFP